MYLDYVLLGSSIVVILAAIFAAGHVVKVLARLKK